MYLYFNLNKYGLLVEGFWPGIHRFLEDHYLFDGMSISNNTIKNYKCRMATDNEDIDWTVPEVKNYHLISEIAQVLKDNKTEQINNDIE